ncbi:MAG TPA: Uma2 family endonuclease [Panacibacter sp.]|nr:Uma2 family endonuclease [Panacibacter sp.]
MPLSIREKAMTEDEYIRFEQQSDIRHEYVNGKLIDMPGESIFHNDVVFYLRSLLSGLLKHAGYSIYSSDVKVKLQNEKKYFYPDVFVTKEKPQENSPFIRTAPILIAEVLSESTRKYDTVDKFISYKQFDSLQYYLLIEPETTFISVFSRVPGDDWELSTYSKSDDVIEFGELGVKLRVGEVYGG